MNKNLLRNWMLVFSLISPVLVQAQTDSTTSRVTFQGYLEIYYAYGNNKVSNHSLPNFIYSFNRQNEVALNLGFIKSTYERKQMKANLALMSGTYANANLQAEPGVLKNIYEANVSIKISRKKNLWVDAGILPSHIGFESAEGLNCWTLSRSMLADNSPYYESGVRVAFTSDNSKWFISGLALNGWQRIQKPDGNNQPAFGHQISFAPSPKIMFNSSSFIGSDLPDSLKTWRYFHNFYGKFQVNQNLGFQFGIDAGIQHKEEDKNNRIWYSPVLVIQVAPLPKINIAARCEYFHDPSQVVVNTITPNGFQTYSASVNFDYHIMENAMWRIEARYFHSKDEIFFKNTKHSTCIIFSSLAVSF